MKIRFVGHAGIFVQCQNQTILCDPWLFSKVFNNGWALVSPSSPPSFADVDTIWISHEHPDHFNFPSLKSIPDADKARIKVLYQRHASPRIVDALHKLGFVHVIELPLYRWFRLDDSLEVFCGSKGVMDSFLALREGQECILDINDCVFNLDQLRYIKRHIGKVSGLFTQFSFANWVGNDYDERHGARRKIAQLRQQIEVFEPEFTVPFASFVYFCNQENSRMNAWANTPDTIAQLKLKGVNFMYPGDEWDSDQRTFDSEKALEKYRADYANVQIDPTPTVVDIARISQTIEKNLQETAAKVPKVLLKKSEPFAIYVHDLDKVEELEPAQGEHRIVDGDSLHKESARYVMCSQVAWFTFAFSFGPDTLQISGMYLDRQYGKPGKEVNRYFWIQEKLSTEVVRLTDLKGTLRTIGFWWRKKAEKFYQYTGGFRGQKTYDE